MVETNLNFNIALTYVENVGIHIWVTFVMSPFLVDLLRQWNTFKVNF